MFYFGCFVVLKKNGIVFDYMMKIVQNWFCGIYKNKYYNYRFDGWSNKSHWFKLLSSL